MGSHCLLCVLVHLDMPVRWLKLHQRHHRHYRSIRHDGRPSPRFLWRIGFYDWSIIRLHAGICLAATGDFFGSFSLLDLFVPLSVRCITGDTAEAGNTSVMT
ncbi:hypothetical protein ASPFODRAFT_605440 [Aspergillus luchuensis CBS 106.47]|uniref:Uncharacterized protein n=1 Tax=Aspergillus luchuensis (strain CBS 106.47) TaxID=1137211 RepID=A0A1M3TIG8_ASPLC|nr:hypothetical protein ASPFODRAFT_605440 [Aspergillus luchuensis CBS 106.47]